MADRIVLPKVGLTATSARLVDWLVALGEPIEVGTTICEIETEKVTVGVDATVGGVLLARIEPDQDVPVGATIAIVGRADEQADESWLYGQEAAAAARAGTPVTDDRNVPAPAAAAPDRGASRVPASSDRGGSRVAASPAARTRAVELGIDLASVAGTGPGGRVTLDDVENAARR